MSKTRRERCLQCGSLDVIKWGVRGGHQRFKCKNCNSMFTFRRKDVSKSNRFTWFKWWIVGKQTIQQISSLSGYSPRQLSRWFDEYLDDYPTWKINGVEMVNLLIDGTWFSNKTCLIVYRDQTTRKTVFYRVTDGEVEREIEEDLRNIQSLGIIIDSVTCDGSQSILKAVRTACPNAGIQRCLVHIQRECKTWLTKQPQSKAGIELHELVQLICHIKTANDMLQWKRMLSDWHSGYVSFINEKTTNKNSGKEWYTHKMLRKAYVHLRRALPYMFTFIDNPNIPNSTNALESFFGHLKNNIELHRGLSLKHHYNYLKWYLYFNGEEEKKTGNFCCFICSLPVFFYSITNRFWQLYQKRQV